LQDLTHCDYFRTSVVFQALDIYNIVGGIWHRIPALIAGATLYRGPLI